MFSKISAPNEIRPPSASCPPPWLRGSQKQFSFQIGKRTLYLDEAVPAEWQPVWIETLRDLFELCTRGMLTREECWQLWRVKKPSRDPQEGPDKVLFHKVLFHIELLELQRPLGKIAAP